MRKTNKNSAVRNIIDVCSRLLTLCEGFDKNAKGVVVSSKIKFLLILDEQEKTSPSMLTEKLGLAKSNLALLCKKMMDEQLICSTRDDFDNRIVFYSLTPKGKEYLEQTLDKMTFNLKREISYKTNPKQIEKCLNDIKLLLD